MKQRTQDLLFAACGIASVVVLLAGVGIGAAGDREFATATSSTAQVTKALATPAGNAVWTGAYMELLSFGFFIAFAVWACTKLGGGVLGSIGRAAATAYTTLGVASLCLMGAIEYRAGHGVGLQLGRTLITLNEALYIGTWFLAVFFLLAVGPLALASGRRLLGWSAIATAAITLVTTAASFDNLGQMSNLLWLAWIVAASIALGRGEREHRTALTAAQHT
jgi:hypothetical protein